MQPSTTALVVAGVGVAGILVGHLFTRSWQHEQWLRDKRYQDYQDVLSAVTTAYMAIIRVDRMEGTSLYNEDMVKELEVIKVEAFRVLRDRIFIAYELAEADILGEWDSAVTNFEKLNIDDVTFAKRFNVVNDKLVRMALNPAKRPWWPKRCWNRRNVAKFRAEHPQ